MEADTCSSELRIGISIVWMRTWWAILIVRTGFRQGGRRGVQLWTITGSPITSCLVETLTQTTVWDVVLRLPVSQRVSFSTTKVRNMAKELFLSRGTNLWDTCKTSLIQWTSRLMSYLFTNIEVWVLWWGRNSSPLLGHASLALSTHRQTISISASIFNIPSKMSAS